MAFKESDIKINDDSIENQHYAEENEEEQKWCICQDGEKDDTDMIACDNPHGCPIEWFHIECVGLNQDSVPEGDWFCQTCREQLDKNKAKPMVFICEFCEEEFDDKKQCLAHKEQHLKQFSTRHKKRQSQKASKKSRNAPYPAEKLKKSAEDASPQVKERVGESDGQLSEQTQEQGSENEGAMENSTNSGKVPGSPPITNDTPASLETNDQKATEEPTNEQSDDAQPPPSESPPLLSLEKQRQLAHFSDEQILAELAKRQEAQVCVCGTVFRDQTLYYLHRSTHNTNNPRKCSQCDYLARDWYDFTSHFFIHRKSGPA